MGRWNFYNKSINSLLFPRTIGRFLPIGQQGFSNEPFRRAASVLSVFVFSVFVSIVSVSDALAQSLHFSTNTTAPNSPVRMTYTFTNAGGSLITDLAFSHSLPASPGAMTIAPVPNVSSDCGRAVITAPSGGARISVADAAVPPSSNCTISLDVQADTDGSYSTTTGPISASGATFTASTGNLTVNTPATTFQKSYAPSSIAIGGVTTLTYTFDNSASGSAVGRVDFTDTLPAGLVVATPLNASTDCVSSLNSTTLTANPGAAEVSLAAAGHGFGGFEVLSAGATCSASVDVLATGSGSFTTTTTGKADFTDIGNALATLTVSADTLNAVKTFETNPASAGDATVVRYDFTNTSRDTAAISMGFTEDFNATVAGLTADSVLSNSCGGTTSGLGTSSFSLANASVPAAGTCSIRLTLNVPAGAASGDYTSTSGPISANFGPSTQTFAPASASLQFLAATSLPPVLAFSASDSAPGARQRCRSP